MIERKIDLWIFWKWSDLRLNRFQTISGEAVVCISWYRCRQSIVRRFQKLCELGVEAAFVSSGYVWCSNELDMPTKVMAQNGKNGCLPAAVGASQNGCLRGEINVDSFELPPL